jgi:hypothetical protein
VTFCEVTFCGVTFCEVTFCEVTFCSGTGKLGCQDVVSAVRPGRLFYIIDSVSNHRYLVDTGSAFSIMPWKSSDTPAGPSLTAADGRRIPCWGEQSFTVTTGSVPRRRSFLLAAVSFPIIGIDFLRSHGLLVDVANLRLLPGELPVTAVGLVADQAAPAARPRSYAEAVKGTSPPPPCAISFSGAPQSSVLVFSLVEPSPVSPAAAPAARTVPPPASDWAGNLRSRFPAVFTASSAVSLAQPPHGVQHVISTVGQPSTTRFLRLDPARLAAAKVEFQAMLDEGVIATPAVSGVAHYIWSKEGWFVAALRRLLPPESPDDGGQMPAT